MKEEPSHNIILLKLDKLTHDQFLDAFYHVIESSPADIIQYEESAAVKVNKLGYILKYFEEKEEYEKCLKIKELQNLLALKYNET
jgi:hypothetical protein